MPKKVAFQGEPGAFSDDAARQLLPEAITRGYGTFDGAARAAQTDETDFALLPVENSISGAVPRVYDLLWDDSRLQIVDEIVYRVVQNLIGLPDAAIGDLREVRSHPVALEQCRTFLSEHPNMRPVIVADTAGAVREITELEDPRVGAIASRLAAKRYGAVVMAEAVQDVPENFTRFFLLRRDAEEAASPTRACVALSLAHKPGSLRDALSRFADANLNLRTLVSRPSPDEPFTYRFYCEVEPIEREALAHVLGQIDGSVRVLGIY